MSSNVPVTLSMKEKYMTSEEFIKRGWEYYKKDDFDNAIADYDEAIRLDPENGRAYGQRGMANLEKNGPW